MYLFHISLEEDTDEYGAQSSETTEANIGGDWEGQVHTDADDEDGYYAPLNSSEVERINELARWQVLNTTEEEEEHSHDTTRSSPLLVYLESMTPEREEDKDASSEDEGEEGEEEVVESQGGLSGYEGDTEDLEEVRRGTIRGKRGNSAENDGAESKRKRFH